MLKTRHPLLPALFIDLYCRGADARHARWQLGSRSRVSSSGEPRTVMSQALVSHRCQAPASWMNRCLKPLLLLEPHQSLRADQRQRPRARLPQKAKPRQRRQRRRRQKRRQRRNALRQKGHRRQRVQLLQQRRKTSRQKKRSSTVQLASKHGLIW